MQAQTRLLIRHFVRGYLSTDLGGGERQAALSAALLFSPSLFIIVVLASKYVMTPFPVPGARTRVSSNGGGWARWNPKGGEMFYLAPNDDLVAVSVTMQSGGIRIGTPTRLFAATSRPGTRLDAFPYDVAPDGRRFLVNTIAASPGPDTLTLVINWQARSR